ncbi:unnamed protein product [Cylicocyclus nassatus]|uniref:Uncharacterized protein n=1 Tax=Cylicocyclus nassatus TaxID=53992 RepID=A0AA36M7Q0_CYLNA|nr:unnamed protein product [Cylicocyclus nassatus]
MGNGCQAGASPTVRENEEGRMPAGSGGSCQGPPVPPRGLNAHSAVTGPPIIAVMRGERAEMEQISDWSIENVIDWKRIVSKYYDIKGIKDESEGDEQ